MFNKIADIVKGFYHLWFCTDSKIESVASNRFEECLFCSHKDNGKNKCNECGCYLPAKVRCISKTNDCPNGKWISNDVTNYYIDGRDTLLEIIEKEVNEYSESLPKDLYYIFNRCKKLASSGHFRKYIINTLYSDSIKNPKYKKEYRYKFIRMTVTAIDLEIIKRIRGYEQVFNE